MAEQRQPLPTLALMREMGLSEEEIARRKAFLEFGDEDVERLRGIHDLAEQYAEGVIEDFYAHLLSFAESRPFFTDPAVLGHVKAAQKQYFLGLTQGQYDAPYVEDRLRIGIAHERINLPLPLYLGAYNFYLRTVMRRFVEVYKDSSGQSIAVLMSLLKLVFLDMGLATETYLFQRERTIREQQEAIREISTPVLPLRERLLLLPIIGAIDPPRAQQITTQLLQSIRAHRAKVVVMDITGVPTVDSAIANHLIQTVQAARLMGAAVIVSGLSPEVAHALVRIGVDLSAVNTVGTLQDGIEAAEQLLGYAVSRAGDTSPSRDGEGS
ncbi:MAG TPA: protoglobin domain-containing protein [Candidatus Binatia bacterium]|nr:protoglobin domain-containing protein [Candidatus Binatia bacterium]